jgi:hypothetical protein
VHSTREARVTDGKIAKTVHESIPSWPVERRPRESSPNNLVVLFDDTGFSEFRLLQFTDPHAGHRLVCRRGTPLHGLPHDGHVPEPPALPY